MANLINSHIVALLIIITLSTMNVLSKFIDSTTPRTIQTSRQAT